MDFRYDQALYLLIFIPVLAGLFLFNERRREKIIGQFGNPELLENLSNALRGRRSIKNWIFLLGLLLLVIGAARPRFGTKGRVITGKGVDVMVAIDTSKSMYAEDVKPNRFEKARFEVFKLIDKLRGNSIGLIAFSGRAFPECPMTVDYGALNMILKSISVGMIPVPGTALEEAVRGGVNSLERGRAKSKALVIITDGENHTGDPVAAAEYAKKKGVVIYTVGIGSKNGVPIPEKDKDGKSRGFKTDSNGKTVITRLNTEILKSIALKSGGGFFVGPEGISSVAELIKKMEKSNLGSKNVVRYEDRFQYVVFLGFLCFLIEPLIPERGRIPVDP